MNFAKHYTDSIIIIIIVTVIIIAITYPFKSIRHEKQVRTDWNHVNYKFLYNLRWMN